jgi:chromatin segregation and condensation protein Rec8/ScpA/Scc1 (kleisin family)
MLELVRQRTLILYQDRPFGTILLSLNRENEKEQEDGA